MSGTTSRTSWAAMVVGLALASAGCGGGGSGGGDGGGLTFRVLWENRGDSADRALDADAFASVIPKAVNTVRITLTPSGDPADSGCCVAVRRGTQAFADRILLLDGVAPGDQHVGLRGYATDFAPADGTGGKCATVPSSAGVSCDSSRSAAPSFDSDGATVTVEAGERSDAGDILLYSVPFPVSLSPAEDATALGPNVAFTGVIADAVNDVLSTSVDVAMGSVGAATEPISLDPLVACDDFGGGGAPTCSTGGVLEVRGYRVTGTSAVLADGPATLNVVATNDASPARSLDFSHDFVIGSSTTSTTTTSTTTTSVTTTTLPTGGTTTTTVTAASTTTTTPVGSTTSTTLAPLRSCTVLFGTKDTVDLSGISFEVDYSSAPGDFVGNADAVQCRVAAGLAATSAFNDQESARTLIAALVTGGTISAPTDLVECDYLGSLPPIDTDFVVSVREAFDDALAQVPVTVGVVAIACAP